MYPLLVQLSRVCSDCYAGDAFMPRCQKGHFPDNTLHWPNADVMMGHCLRRWAIIILARTRYALITNIIVNILFSEHFLKTQVLNLRTSNVIFDLFIRTVSQKYQPLPTHCTPLPPKQDTNSGAIKLIGSGFRPGLKHTDSVILEIHLCIFYLYILHIIGTKKFQALKLNNVYLQYFYLCKPRLKI